MAAWLGLVDRSVLSNAPLLCFPVGEGGSTNRPLALVEEPGRDDAEAGRAVTTTAGEGGDDEGGVPDVRKAPAACCGC